MKCPNCGQQLDSCRTKFANGLWYVYRCDKCNAKFSVQTTLNMFKSHRQFKPMTVITYMIDNTTVRSSKKTPNIAH